MNRVLDKMASEILLSLAILFSTPITGITQQSNAGPVAGTAAGSSSHKSNVTATITVAQSVAQMGDWLTVTVDNPPAAFTNAIISKKKPALYLGDFPLKGLSSEISFNTNSANLQFHLQWTDSSS